jgi:hypothetical protein
MATPNTSLQIMLTDSGLTKNYKTKQYNQMVTKLNKLHKGAKKP